MTGFLEEAPGVRSMTRLVAAAQTLACLGIVATICVVAVRGSEHAPATIAALTASLLPQIGGVWTALKERQ